jgi:ketosteroid isomerase-like protein
MQPTSTHTQQSQSIQELIAFEKARMEATRTANTAQLEQMLADDLVWVHSSGKRQTKAQYIADLNTKKTVYRSITLEETNARVYGDIAVTNGTASYKTTEQTVRAYHTCVYRKSSSGAWQVIAWQTTKVGK